MIAPSHLVVGQFAYFCAAVIAAHKPQVAEAFVAAVCALLPDLDKRDGMVGRWFPWLSGPIEHWVGHRTATHSILASVLIASLAWLLPAGYWLAVVAGFASHAVADMMTPAGVAWLWPSRVRCVLPGNEKFRMSPMGVGELWFVIVVTVLTFPVAGIAQHGAGPLGTVRDMMGWFTDARLYYDAHKSEADWWLDLSGQDNRAFQAVSGRFRVIGPWQSGGLLLETPAGVVSICREGMCDWYPERAVLQRGVDEQTTTRDLKTKVTSTGALIRALESLNAVGRIYVVGTLRGGIPAAPPTVTAASTGSTHEKITLTYARLQDLQEWPAGDLFDVDLTVQVRHPPGAEVPFVDLEAKTMDLSGLIRRHLP